MSKHYKQNLQIYFCIEIKNITNLSEINNSSCKHQSPTFFLNSKQQSNYVNFCFIINYYVVTSLSVIATVLMNILVLYCVFPKKLFHHFDNSGCNIQLQKKTV